MPQTDTYKLRLDTQQAQNGLKSLTTAMKGFAAALAVRELVQFGQQIIRATSEFQNYQNQLRLVTNGTEDLARLTGVLQQAAVKNRTAFADTVDLFTKLRVSTEALGIAEDRVIGVTGKLSQALQVAGADAATTNAVIRQFGQAMASGEVRGDEFRSIVEGLGPALAIMARESGLTVGALRRMSQAGELTAETMFKLFENSEALTSAFNTMVPTINQLETATADAFDRMLIKIGEVTGATKAYEKGVRGLGRLFDSIAGTEGALVNLSDAEIMEQVEQGIIGANVAITEFQDRLDGIYRKYTAGWAGMFPPMEAIEKEQAPTRALMEKLKVIAEEADKLAKANAEREKQARENNRRYNFSCYSRIFIIYRF